MAVRIRWQPRHWFWLALTVVVVGAVVGKRLWPERPVAPIGGGTGAPAGQPANTVDRTGGDGLVVVSDWPALSAFDGPYRFDRVLPLPQPQPPGADGRLVVRVSRSGEPLEVALAAVTLAAADGEARQSAQAFVEHAVAEQRKVYVLWVAGTADAQGRPLGYVALAEPRPRPRPQQPPPGNADVDAGAGAGSGEPGYRLLNRELALRGLAHFDADTARGPAGELDAVEQLALVVHVAATEAALRRRGLHADGGE